MDRLQRALRRARKKRGLSIGQAASLMEPPVAWQTLANLERGHPERGPAEGGNVRLKTVLAIVDAYYPDVQLSDFGVRTRLRYTISRLLGRRAS